MSQMYIFIYIYIYIDMHIYEHDPSSDPNPLRNHALLIAVQLPFRALTNLYQLKSPCVAPLLPKHSSLSCQHAYPRPILLFQFLPWRPKLPFWARWPACVCV